MKIGVGIGSDAESDKAAESRAHEKLILSAKMGDWEAKNLLAQQFHPFIASLADKRTQDAKQASQYVEAGKAGLAKAVTKYKSSVGPDNFRIFALDFIEAAMNKNDKGEGILSRLFGRKG